MPSKVKNYLIALLALSTAACALIAFTQSRRLAALEAELLKASEAAASLKPRATPAASTFNTSAPVETAAAIPAEVDPAPAGEEARAPRQRGGNNNRGGNFAALMENPEFAKAMSVQQRASLDARYADLFKKLNLTPAQLEQFKNLLVERQNTRMDVMVAAREGGLDPRENRDELRKMTAEAQAEVDNTIKTALGETVYNQYQTYENTQAQRSLVKQLDSRLGYTSAPLTESQSDFLVSALAASGATTEQGGAPGGWGGGSRAVITDAVIQQAQSVLNSAQVEALKQLQTEQQAQQTVRDMMRARQNNNGNGGGQNTNR